MRKNIKKIVSVLVALTMIMMLGVASFAADTYTIKITRPAGDTATHTYKVYQVFSGDKEEYPADSGKYILKNIEWGDGVNSTKLLDDLKTLDNDTFGDCTDAASVAAALEGYAQADAVAKIIAKTANLGTASDTQSGSGSTPTTLTVPETGYYIVTDSVSPVSGAQGTVSQYMLKVVTKDATTNINVEAKEEVPSIDKVIVEGSDEVKANTASVGDLIQFRIKSTVPDVSERGYNGYWFVIKDTLCKGLKYDASKAALTVKVGSTTLDADDYVLTTSDAGEGKTLLQIVINDLFDFAPGGNCDVVVEYKAELTKDCDMTTAGNPNTVNLTYSNDPNQDYSGNFNPNGPVGKTPDAVTKTYTTGITVIKVDPQGNRLTGAEFEIELSGTSASIVVTERKVYTPSASGTFYKLKDGTYTTDAPTPATEESYASTTQKYTLTVEVENNDVPSTHKVIATVDDAGCLIFEGLGKGTYTITEKKAPAGYSKDDTTYTVTIGTDGAPTITGIDWTYSVNNGTTTSTPDAVVLQFVNVKTSNLPETGGIGTTVFYIAGSVLVLAGVALIVAKKKMGSVEAR